MILNPRTKIARWGKLAMEDEVVLSYGAKVLLSTTYKLARFGKIPEVGMILSTGDKLVLDTHSKITRNEVAKEACNFASDNTRGEEETSAQCGSSVLSSNTFGNEVATGRASPLGARRPQAALE